MIQSFADKRTAAVFAGLPVKRLPPELLVRAHRKLAVIDAATSLDELRLPPSNHLEPLLGDRLGQWSIRINNQWRICFRFAEGNVHDVEIVDYH